MRWTRYLLVACLALPIGALGPDVAQAEDRSAPAEFGLGVGSVVCSFFYGPVKVIYAVGGTLTGGLAWVLTGGRGDVFRAIVQPAVRGDYVVVPENLTFEKPLVFAGRDPKRSSFSP
jgi:hypothetical protein